MKGRWQATYLAEASLHLSLFRHTGGNGKQIFGDAWWLEPEADARIAAELAGTHPQALDQSATFAAAKAAAGLQGGLLAP